MVLGIVKKCIRMCGRLVVLNISVMLNEMVEIGFLMKFFGVIIDRLILVVLLGDLLVLVVMVVLICMVLVNSVFRLKLYCVIIMIVMKVMLVSSMYVLMICI